MIGVHFMGGLGNQMFQYAAARRLASVHDTSVAMDMAFFEDTTVDTPREYELDCFKFNASVISPAKRPAEQSDNRYAGKLGKARLAQDKLAGKYWLVYREPHYNFDSSVLNLPDQSYLIGYWQTEKYFADIRDEILADFSFIEQPGTKNKKLLDHIRSTPSVSIHVRRGDYVTNKNANAFHGTKDNAYYQAALKPILKELKDPVLFVFSDDPAWCKANLKFDQETVYVEGNEKGCEDMRLMMHCQHNIIANSSFSWWAAWLNQNPNKLVVAPKTWFNDPSVDTSDVLPKAWLKI